MNAVFLKILNMSLTASLLILAVLPIRILMKKAPKWTTCLLWGMVAVALICPVRFESPASVLPVTDPIVITQNDAQATDTLPLYQEEPILIQDIIEQKPLPTKPNYVEIGGIIWCMGMLTLLGYAAFSWLRLKRRVAASVEIEKHVYLCDDIDTPFILGIVRPHIYLPSSLDDLTVQQVLTHERAHLARKDHWWKPLGYLLLTLHWFNPLVWVAYALLCTDIELACDEKVIKDMDASSKQAYSEALLTCSMPRHMIAACPLAFGEVGVKQRIKAVLHYKKPAFWLILIAIVVCAALCMGFLTKPNVVTLGSQIDLSPKNYDCIHIAGSDFYKIHDPSALCGLLSELELRERMGTPKLPDEYYAISLMPKESGISDLLYFSLDCRQLWINHTVEDPNNTFQSQARYYDVLNPEMITDRDRSFLTTEYLHTNDIPKISLDPSEVTQITAELTPTLLHYYTDEAEIESLCTLMNIMKLSRDTTTTMQDTAFRLQFHLTDETVISMDFNITWTECQIFVYQLIDGIHQTTLQTQVCNIKNCVELQTHPLLNALEEKKFLNTMLSFEEMQTMLEEYLRNQNRHYDNLQLLNLSSHDIINDMTYAIVMLDWLSHDGAVTAENCLYLVGFTNGRVDGMAAGQWPGDAGYYPNVADFNGKLVLWSARSATRAALNEDGTINPNETVSNDYDEYRITFDDGNTTFYELGEGRLDNPIINLIHHNRRPVKIAPIDYYGFEVEAFTFTEDALTPTNVNTISEVSGWDAFLNMDADSGEILSIYSYPTLQETPVYLDMDASFRGYEALYHAIKTDGIEALADTVGLTLEAHQSYNGYEYAVIRQKDNPADVYGLLEYTVNADGTVTLLDFGRGSAPEVMGKFGYAMSCATMNGGTLYWTLFTDERWATTADGTETDNTKTVPTDYTGFRFIWADLQEKEYPVEGSFFLAEVDSVIPPAIAIPLVGDTAVTALGWRLP